MSEAIITVILAQATMMMDELLRKEGRSVRRVKREIKKLESEVKAIKAVLVDADKRRVKEQSVRVWLEKLKDVCYEAEKVLNECIAAMNKGETEEDHGTKSSSIEKVLPCLNCSRIFLHRDIARKIKKVNKRLGSIATEKERYQVNEFTGSKSCPSRQKTTSFINVSEVKGRDQDKKTIISKLFTENNQDKGLNIVSIVGVEGVGKTTLAQLVYNSDDVIQNFEVRIWVCAADPNFDEIRIAKAILEGITCNGDDSNLFQLETIARNIREGIGGKKFLLVLDDVYIDDFREWEQVFNTLTTGAAGSTILVTTTEESAAIAMRRRDQLLLGELSPDDSWCLFKDTAFLEQNKAQWERLEMIWTSKIAEKCKGSPLTIKRIGIQLGSKEPDEWEEILSREFSD